MTATAQNRGTAYVWRRWERLFFQYLRERFPAHDPQVLTQVIYGWAPAGLPKVTELERDFQDHIAEQSYRPSTVLHHHAPSCTAPTGGPCTCVDEFRQAMEP